MDILEAASIFAGGVAGGSTLTFFFTKPLQISPEQVREMMNRVVNVESMEEHERLLKVRMARQGLKSMRVDGGQNARVMRMRIRPRPKSGG